VSSFYVEYESFVVVDRLFSGDISESYIGNCFARQVHVPHSQYRAPVPCELEEVTEPRTHLDGVAQPVQQNSKAPGGTKGKGSKTASSQLQVAVADPSDPAYVAASLVQESINLLGVMLGVGSNAGVDWEHLDGTLLMVNPNRMVSISSPRHFTMH